MDKTTLRDGLMEQLWRMYKMDIMVYLREFLFGETAALECLFRCDGSSTPTALAEEMKLSRPRTANILSTLRKKGFIDMSVDEADRRRMNVVLTPVGLAHLGEKHAYLERYFDACVEVLGEENITELTSLLRQTADMEGLLLEKFYGSAKE